MICHISITYDIPLSICHTQVMVTFNNYLLKAKWIFFNIPQDEVEGNIHEPEANNCFSIIIQVIIEIPQQRDVTNFTTLCQFIPHYSHQCVTQCLFELALWRKKTFSLTFIPGKNKSKCGFVVCTLIDNGYASLLFSQTMFSYCFCMLSEFQKFLDGKLM